MARYFFELVDGEHSFMDDAGRELDNLYEAHLYALRMFQKLIEFIPDQLTPSCRIRIKLATGEIVLSVFIPAVASEERLRRVAG
jgi:hypothetical protein